MPSGSRYAMTTLVVCSGIIVNQDWNLAPQHLGKVSQLAQDDFISIPHSYQRAPVNDLQIRTVIQRNAAPNHYEPTSVLGIFHDRPYPHPYMSVTREYMRARLVCEECRTPVSGATANPGDFGQELVHVSDWGFPRGVCYEQFGHWHWYACTPRPVVCRINGNYL